MNVLYTERSEIDIEIAYDWYNLQVSGLGDDFLDSIEDSIDQISNHPDMFQVRYSVFRGCPIKRFPFVIYYTVEEDFIVIHSVFDSRQNPKKKP